MPVHAELVIDLHDVGVVAAESLERDDHVLPSLGKIATMWRTLGIDVTAMHVVKPGYSLRSSPVTTVEESRATTWWETESVFLEDEGFDVEIVHSAVGEDGFVGHEALVVTTALRRSDALGDDDADAIVIVMSNAAAVAPAVTHARGVPVMLAGTEVVDPSLAHALLDAEWFASFANRFADLPISDVELRDGHPWRDDQSISTPFTSLLGRDTSLASLPTMAESAVLFDADYFGVAEASLEATPTPTGVASVVRLLGLGELVHVEPATDGPESTVETTLVATLYRFAADHPELPIIVASNRPGVVVATSDLAAFGLRNARRFLRLCLPFRKSTFDESAFSGHLTAPRVVLERSLSEPLFAEDDASVRAPSVDDRGDDHSSSPSLILFANPNTAREDSTNWREATGRRFITLGDAVLDARPADQPEAEALPVSLGGCTDFSIRRPDLEPGSIVEAILDTTRQRWLIVSDPIERRTEVRALEASDDHHDIVTMQDAA